MQSLSENPLCASKLGELIEKDPEMTTRLMKDCPVRISGRITKIGVYGFENNRAEITLGATPLTEIVVVQDLKQNRLDGLQSTSRSQGLRWQLQAGQLFLGTQGGSSHVRLFGPGETFPATSVQYLKTTGSRKIYLSSTAPVASPSQIRFESGSQVGRSNK